MTALLEVSDLCKSFGGLKALDRLSFSIEPGRILGLIGPNGSGKTTTVNIITGIYGATGGSVAFAGQDVTGQKPHKVLKAGLVRTFQNLRLFSTQSVLDNIRAGQNARCKSWLTFLSAVPTREERDLHREAVALAERFQLGGKLQVPAGDLAYGEKKRLEIARALASRPRILLLDEPAAGMNPSELQWLTDTLSEIRASGISILLIEHHMKLVMSVCDNIVVLNFGCKIAEGTPETISRDPDVIAAYLGTSD